PTSSIAPTADVAFEHRMYLPLAAVVAVAVIGGFELTRRLFAPAWQAASQGTLLLLAAAALGFATHQRNQLYGDEIAFWNDVLEKAPKNPRARVQSGLALYNSGQNREAILRFNEALDLFQKYAPLPVY